MLLNFLSSAFRLAVGEGLTLGQRVTALRVVLPHDHLLVGEHTLATLRGVGALELERLEIPQELLPHRDELRSTALHGTGASLSTELIQTCRVEVVFAILTL
jgi:hypothetical protein